MGDWDEVYEFLFVSLPHAVMIYGSHEVDDVIYDFESRV